MQYYFCMDLIITNITFTIHKITTFSINSYKIHCVISLIVRGETIVYCNYNDVIILFSFTIYLAGDEFFVMALPNELHRHGPHRVTVM